MKTETHDQQERLAMARAAEALSLKRQAVNRKLSTLQAQRDALALEIEAWTALFNGLEDHPCSRV